MALYGASKSDAHAIETGPQEQEVNGLGEQRRLLDDEDELA